MPRVSDILQMDNSELNGILNSLTQRPEIDKLKNKIVLLEEQIAVVETIKGDDGKDGLNGLDGKDGKDGINGRDGLTGLNGKDGLDGKDGEDGKDGISVSDASLDFANNLTLELSNGDVIDAGQITLPDFTGGFQSFIREEGGGGGGIDYPPAGIPNSTGTAWGTSYGVTGTGSVVLSDSPTITTALTATGALQLTGSDTVNQAIASAQTSGNLTIGGTGAQTGTIILGGATGTGVITIGRSTGLQTVNIATGLNTAIKTINIGTVGTGTTNINIGNPSGGGLLIFGASTGSQTVSIAMGANTGNKVVNIGTGSPSGATTINVGSTLGICITTVNGTLRQQTYLVANLPTGIAGARSFVTNALSPTFGATVVGGGAVGVPVYHDGTSWKVG